MKHTSKVASFFLFPMLVFLIHLIASKVLNLYTTFPHMDIPFHYIGGLSIAYTSTHVLSHFENQRMIPALNKVVFLVLVCTLTATAAVFWEFAEFTGDQLFRTNIQVSLANTMQDQFMGILGGATWSILHFRSEWITAHEN